MTGNDMWEMHMPNAKAGVDSGPGSMVQPFGKAKNCEPAMTSKQALPGNDRSETHMPNAKAGVKLGSML